MVYMREYKMNIGSFNDAPELIYKLYRGELENDGQISEFKDSELPEVIDFRNTILKAFRIAFHISYEGVLYYGFDEYSN